MAQDAAARRMESKWSLDCVVSDGNTLLSTMGRAANYLYPASEGEKSFLDLLDSWEPSNRKKHLGNMRNYTYLFLVLLTGTKKK